MNTTPLLRRAVAEFLGSGLLVTVVVGSGIAAQRLSADIGLRLLENSTATVFGLGVPPHPRRDSHPGECIARRDPRVIERFLHTMDLVSRTVTAVPAPDEKRASDLRTSTPGRFLWTTDGMASLGSMRIRCARRPSQSLIRPGFEPGTARSLGRRISQGGAEHGKPIHQRRLLAGA